MNQTFTISKAIANVPAEGTYRMRIDAIEVQEAKEAGKSASLKFDAIIVGGDEDGRKATWWRTTDPRYLGFVARDLANTQAFDTETEELPVEAGALARILDERLVGRVYLVDVKHQRRQGSQDVRGDYAIVGPSGP